MKLPGVRGYSPARGFRAGFLGLAAAVSLLLEAPLVHAQTQGSAASDANAPIAHALIQKTLDTYQQIASYEVVLGRQYRKPDQKDRIFLHFEKPDILFMEWLEGDGRDRQLLYAPHAFGSKLQVRPPGLFFRFIPIVELDKTDPRILKTESRSIDRAGIGPFLEKFSQDFFAAESDGKLRQVTVRTEAPAGLDVTFEDPAREYPRVNIVFDPQGGLPSRIELYRADTPEPDVYEYSSWDFELIQGGALSKHLDPRLNSYLKKARGQSD